jgi:GT2 family glycosyltransferase/nucleoside-diphosphate-sugar epimerase
MITVPRVSVVIVSYRTGPTLWLAIAAALEQPECCELLLVDNGNTPGDRARIKATAASDPRFKLISGHGNVGFSRGCNLGVSASSGDYILLLNPDSMLPEGGLARAVEVLRTFPENTLAGCYLVNPDGSEQRGGRRALLTPKNAVGESLGLTRFWGTDGQLNFHGTRMPEQAHEVPAISGAFMMLSRAFYQRLGGLDEGYFLHMEDMDFCARVHKAGGKVICMPEVKVIHFRSTSEAANSVVEKHKTRGFIRYLKKHFGKEYSPLALSFLSLGIWLRYGLKVFIGALDKAFVPPLAAKREIARIVLLYRLARFGPRDNSLAGKTILVAGGSGQVGLCAVGKALARGARVVAMYNRTVIPFSHPNLEWVRRDLTKSAFEGLKADVLVYTLSIWTLPDKLASISDAGIRRVIAYSSTSRFSKVTSKNRYEQDIVQKLASGEEQSLAIAMEKSVAVTILRPTMIYGVGLDANITRLADVVRRFGFLVVYGKASGLRMPVQAMDLAAAALDASYNPVTIGKCYNLGGSQIMTYRSMIMFLFQYLGRKARIFRPPFLPFFLDLLGKVYQVGYLNGEMAQRMNQDLVFDMQDAINDFGYRPKGFLQGDAVI